MKPPCSKRFKQNQSGTRRKDRHPPSLPLQLAGSGQIQSGLFAAVEAENSASVKHTPVLTQYAYCPIWRRRFSFRSTKSATSGHHSANTAEKVKSTSPVIRSRGEAEAIDDQQLRALKPRRDSTVITIGGTGIIPWSIRFGNNPA